MLAPMMTLIAGRRPSTPALTRPTTMTVIAVLDWMTPVMSVPASTPLIGVPAILRQQRAHPADGEVLDAVGHELEAEHEDAEPADHRHEDVLEMSTCIGPPYCSARHALVASELAAQFRTNIRSRL